MGAAVGREEGEDDGMGVGLPGVHVGVTEGGKVGVYVGARVGGPGTSATTPPAYSICMTPEH